VNSNTEDTNNNAPLLLDDEFLKQVPHYNPGMVALVRANDLRIFFVNKQFEHYLGYSNKDLTDAEVSFSGIIEQYQHDHLLDQLTYCNDTIDQLSGYVIYKLKSKEGKRSPYYLYTSEMRYDERYGQLYFFLLHPDLSKWGMPFTSVDSKELLMEQFNSEDFGTYEWVIDIDKLLWSVGVYRIYEIDDLDTRIDHNFYNSFIHPADKERVERAAAQAMQNREDLNIEYRIITAKQNIKTIHCLARVIVTQNNHARKVAGSIRDITDQRSIENDLKNKVAELNQSNKELGEFAYVASHDMQEPLRKISTFSDRLSEKYKDVLTGDGQMYLARIIASAQNMRILIDNLLEFSKVSKTGQHFDPVDLNITLRQVMNDLELVTEETGTVVHFPKLPVIKAVSSQMKQLFSNLISNAIKFHKKDVPPVITITCEVLKDTERYKHELNPKKAYYKISVSDNGIGFEEEYAQRIFQVFQRLHGKSDYPGSGIGLSICKKILEYHNGVIYAENIPGTGARFVLIIPEDQNEKPATL
jgi:signal transduction histidine kinase